MLKFRQKTSSDGEFVEDLRRQMLNHRKVAVGLSVLYGALLIGWLYFVVRHFQSFRDLAPDSSAYERGFAFGIVLGAALGSSFIFLLWQLLQSITIAIGTNFFRLHRLLFKYYD